MKIRRALISVWDKTGIVDFARALHTEFGVEIISTGGTAKALRDAGIPVTLVETLTGCGEMLDGRVKTLHPAIHAAILADRDNPDHMRQLEAAGIKPIDLVVVNLYPFEGTVADPNCTFEQAIEMIDIGGVALLRAAAKNHKHVMVWPHSRGYHIVLNHIRSSFAECATLRTAQLAFDATRQYDFAISQYLDEKLFPDHRSVSNLPPDSYLVLNRLGPFRYGENPHQHAAPYRIGKHQTGAQPVDDQSREALSYNNVLDGDAALGLCAELARAAKQLATGLQARRAAATHNQPGAEKAVWYGLPARSSVLRASSPRDRITGETHRRRYLPHIEVPGKTYFVTFRTLGTELTPEARDAVMSACRFWHEKRMTLHICCVMPDHVHMLITPSLFPDGSAVALATLNHSMKGFSAKQVNRIMGRLGELWMQEAFDRIMRDEREYAETWDYIHTNPWREGLGEQYPWLWSSPAGFEEGDWVKEEEPKGGLEARCTEHGLEAHTTPAERGLEAQTTPAAEDNQPVSLRTAVFIKHTNPCGVGIAADPVEAYRLAYLGDPNAAMGGILAVNFEVDAAFAATVMETYDRFGKPLKDAGAAHAPGGFFVEVWIAPSFTDDAVQIIRGTADATAALPNPPKKKWGENVRLLAVGDMTIKPDATALQYRSIAGGLLAQSPDLLGLNEDQWKVVTKRSPTDDEMANLRLAWLICKHTKSNAITLARDGMLLGNGAGQMSRVMSCRLATWLARENGHSDQLAGSVAASDAFFPFADGPNILMDAGVTAIIQPGGSKRDEDTIAACDERGVAMIFTGTRHFRH